MSDSTKGLDHANADPMYLLGRLWAICEDAIVAADGHLDPGIVATLGAQPMVGLALLHGKYNPHHTPKHDELIGQVMELVTSAGFPEGPIATKNQAALYVGYWHQHHALRA